MLHIRSVDAWKCRISYALLIRGQINFVGDIKKCAVCVKLYKNILLEFLLKRNWNDDGNVAVNY